MTSITLDYGLSQRCECDLPTNQLLYVHHGPEPLRDPVAAVREALRQPLEFPALELAVVPDDHVVFVLDRGVPSAAEIVLGAWSAMETAGLNPENILILQPASMHAGYLADPRRLLPDTVRENVAWQIHDPTVQSGIGYLASSAAGERIYLSRNVLDADFVLPIGRFGFDGMLGRREITSAFYPGLSTPDAFVKSIGQGHSELGPDDERPFRQLVHEVAWLMGIQFAIQALPSRSQSGMAMVLAGNPDRVTQHGRSLLDQHWRVMLDQRGETALVAIPVSADETSWADLGAAVEAAQKLVVQGGRIIVLSDLAAQPGPGIELIRNSRSAKSALQPLRKSAPPDLLAASQIASAAEWASIYLLSRLESKLVEESFMTPLDNEREAIRLLETCDGCVVLEGAQHVYSEILP